MADKKYLWDDIPQTSEIKPEDKLLYGSASDNKTLKVTIADFVGFVDSGKPDYTFLDEQKVSGELWLDMDGSSKQVYMRTFAGRLSSDRDSTTLITSGIAAAKVETGFVQTPYDGMRVVGEKSALIMVGDSPFCWEVVTVGYDGSNEGAVTVNVTHEHLREQKYSITLKYIKL